MKTCFRVGVGLLGLTLSVLAVAEKPGAGTVPPIVVSTVPVASQVFDHTVHATGSLFAFDGVTVTSEIEGRIVKIAFESGQMVEQGALLVELDSASIQARLKKAKAQLAVNQANYNRFYQLYLKKFYDKADLDQAAAAVEIAQADVDDLSAQWDKTMIRAPFSGKLGLNQVNVGEYLTPGKPITDLQALDPLYVEFSLPEVDLTNIRLGHRVELYSQAFPGKTGVGQIYAFDSKIDPGTRTLKVRAKIPNADHRLIPGLFAEVTVYVGEPETVLVVPQTALVYDAKEAFLYRFLDHKAVRTPVLLGAKLDNNTVIVRQGLNLGDRVILGGQVKLQDGANVMTIEEATKLMPKKES